MSIELSQFIPSFLEESFEGLELMESSLLSLQPGDDETINSIFRAAHSIKGGAGTFGFDQVTEFTHLVETLLDEMRDGRREIAQADIEILLDSVDCIRILIEAARDDTSYDEDKIAKTSQALEQTLNTAQSVTPNENSPKDDSGLTLWNILFVPEHHLVQTGNDPLLLFSALADLGSLSIQAKINELPALTDMDAEEIYIGWQLELKTYASEADIREVFEWVEDECRLEISQMEALNLPPEEVPKKEVNTTEDAIESSPDTVAKTTTPSVKEDIPNPSSQSNQQAPTANKQDKSSPKAKQEVGSIRVGVDKVDMLINLVGELVITQSMLSELGNDFEMNKVERLTSGLEQLLQNTKELQESVMRIRMLPISFAFNRFPRLVHDLSKKTGKEIELVIKGEQTELDKTVMEQIGDPLVHLVRNAVDHGIEFSDVRVAKGKPAKGTITLDAYHLGGNIVIEINDDGGGIDREAVFNKAVEKNIIEPTTSLSDSQVFDLLFQELHTLLVVL